MMWDSPLPRVFQVLDSGTNFCSPSRDEILFLIHYFSSRDISQDFQLAFFNHNSLYSTYQRINVKIFSTFRYVYPNYTFWKQRNNHRIILGMHCTYFESDYSENSINHLTPFSSSFKWRATMFLGVFWNQHQFRTSFK